MAFKVARKSSLNGPDEFITSTSMAVKFLSDNLKAVVAVSISVGIVFLSYTGWITYSKNRDKKAGDAFYSALSISQAKIDPAGEFKTEDERSRTSINRFLDLANKYKGSRVEEIALLYAANGYYNQKELDKAIDIYNKMLFKIDREDPSLHGNISEVKLSPGIVRDSALFGLAYAYEQKGELKKAIDAQNTLVSSKDSYLREMGLVSLGRLYEKSSDKAKALETYNTIISDFPESPNVPTIKQKIERLKG